MYQVFGSRHSWEPMVWKVIVNDLLHCWLGGDGKGRRWSWLRRCPWIHAGPRRAPNVPSPKGTRVCPLPFHLPSRRPNPSPFKHPYVPATGTQRAKMYIIMHWIATYMCPRLHVVCQTNVVTWSWDRKYLNLNCALTLGLEGKYVICGYDITTSGLYNTSWSTNMWHSTVGYMLSGDQYSL